MRASPKEQQAAREEGVDFLFRHVPEEILGGNRIAAVRFGTDTDDKVLECDALVCAIGQVNHAPDWLLRLGVKTDERGVILIDEQGRTSHPRIYAGGDNSHGPDLVVTAIAAGRRAAAGMREHFHPLTRFRPDLRRSL